MGFISAPSSHLSIQNVSNDLAMGTVSAQIAAALAGSSSGTANNISFTAFQTIVSDLQHIASTSSSCPAVQALQGTIESLLSQCQTQGIVTVTSLNGDGTPYRTTPLALDKDGPEQDATYQYFMANQSAQYFPTGYDFAEGQAGSSFNTAHLGVQLPPDLYQALINL